MHDIQKTNCVNKIMYLVFYKTDTIIFYNMFVYVLKNEWNSKKCLLKRKKTFQ